MSHENQLDRMYASLTNYVEGEIKKAFIAVKRCVDKDFNAFGEELKRLSDRLDALEKRQPQKQPKKSVPTFYSSKKDYRENTRQ